MSPRPLSAFAFGRIAQVQRAVAEATGAPHVPAAIGPESPLHATLRPPVRRQQHEELEQIALFETIFGRAKAGEPYAEPLPGLPRALALLYAIPNAGKRTRAVAGRLKASGLREGFPDLCLPVQRGGFGALYLELKKTNGDSARPEQRAWLQALAAEGHAACVAKGFDAALALLLTYVGIPASADLPVVSRRQAWRTSFARIPGITCYSAEGAVHG